MVSSDKGEVFSQGWAGQNVHASIKNFKYKSTVIQGYENFFLFYAKSAVILGYKCCFNFTLNKQSSRIIKRYKIFMFGQHPSQNIKKFLFCKNIINFFKDISFFYFLVLQLESVPGYCNIDYFLAVYFIQYITF